MHRYHFCVIIDVYISNSFIVNNTKKLVHISQYKDRLKSLNDVQEHLYRTRKTEILQIMHAIVSYMDKTLEKQLLSKINP